MLSQSPKNKIFISLDYSIICASVEYFIYLVRSSTSKKQYKFKFKMGRAPKEL